MSSQAPSSITGRQLASHADVNYGLIHHYFGTKYDVFRAAIDRLVQTYIADTASTSQTADLSVATLRRQRSVWKVFAQFALDDKARSRIKWPYTVMRQELRDLAGEEPDRERRQLAALDSAFTFGWVVFDPLLREAYDLDESDMEEAIIRFRELVATPRRIGE